MPPFRRYSFFKAELPPCLQHSPSHSETFSLVMLGFEIWMGDGNDGYVYCCDVDTLQ